MFALALLDVARAQWGSIAMPPLNSLGTHDKFDTFILSHKVLDVNDHMQLGDVGFSFDKMDEEEQALNLSSSHQVKISDKIQLNLDGDMYDLVPTE